jgi:hypothetical protein
MENYIGILREAHEQLICRRMTISVKDLSLCHMKKVFSVIDPVPMTDEELYEYVSGQASHDVIERLFMVYPNRFRSEMEIQYKNIKGKIDVHDKLLNNIIDIKTSKSQKFLLKPFKFHMEQVKSYMSIMDSEEGQIIYQLDKLGKYLSFPIYMTEAERKEQLNKLKKEAVLLQKAIEAQDPSLVEGIYNDDEIRWLCSKCPYLEKCKGIRPIEHKELNVQAIGTQIEPLNHGNGQVYKPGVNQDSTIFTDKHEKRCER